MPTPCQLNNDVRNNKTGKWPRKQSSEVLAAPGETWSAINASLFKGGRGLPGGSSLAQLLVEKRGVSDKYYVPDLTVEQILKWADAHHRRTGKWPNKESGEVLATPGEKWGNISNAFFKGGRGLPGGSSLAKLLAEKRGVRNIHFLPSLTTNQILKWADLHHQKTGQWPNQTSGDVLGAPGEKWANIAQGFSKGLRGLPSSSSLAQLLEEERGVRNIQALSDLSIEQILKWADAHYRKTGKWPKEDSGGVSAAPDEKWLNISDALAKGRRGLPGGSSLAKLLAKKRGVRNVQALSALTIEQILKWADAHYRKTGQWPNQTSGDVRGAPGEKWGNINGSLFAGFRGLPGGSSLTKLLAEKRGVRNVQALSDLTVEQVLRWADVHHQTRGKWPSTNSGAVIGAPGEKWGNTNAALFAGFRGLAGGSSLAKLLAEKRGVRNRMDLPDLKISRILKWADKHHQETGKWPNEDSGSVLGAPGEKWGNISNSLSRGVRGLPGGSSLAKLLAEKRSKRLGPR